MKTFLPVILLTVLIFIGGSEGANILFFFGVSTYSHRITVWPLVEELADRGHNVTFFQPYPNKKPNPKVTEMRPNVTFPDMSMINLRLETGKYGIWIMVNMLPPLSVSICDEFLSDSDVQNWVKNSTFDLVIVDGLFNDCGFGLAHKFGAKHIIFGPSTVFGWWPDSYGFPAESNWISDCLLNLPMPLSFLGKVVSTLGPLYYQVLRQFVMYPKIEKLLREKLDMPDMPSLGVIERNVSLVLMNTHFSEEVARSLPPLFVPIGGMHCDDSRNPLPKEFTDFIDAGGDNGFIYVSFGSAAKISEAPEEMKQAFFNAMKSSKVRFLWKWEGPRPKEMPENILTSPWMPQQDILAHPKVRAFISHGGLLGIQEAVYHAVPMITIPIFAEQDYNAERVHRSGRGIYLDIEEITEAKLKDAIDDILTDKFRNTMKEVSKRFKDRPQSPIETAIWWTEYVLRHDDTSSLRPLAASQYWFQRRLLDVWAFIFLIVSSSLIIFILVLKKLLCLCFGRNSGKSSSLNSKIKVKKS